jgi:uncharacterized protein (TIGR02444 family)
LPLDYRFRGNERMGVWWFNSIEICFSRATGAAKASTAMTETDAQGSPFWRFSLRFYRQPGVADACIALQDGYGIDVNILLFLLWLAGERRQIGVAEARSLCVTAAPWRDEVVAPLRTLRRRLKDGVALIERNAAELFRTRIKAVELEAERLQQEALFALAASLTTAPAPAVGEAAHANVAAYEAALAVSLPPVVLETLFAALPAGKTGAPRAAIWQSS